MSLQESLKTMQILHDAVFKASAEKFDGAQKFKELLKKLDKPKDEKDFEKIKKECQKVIHKVTEDLVLEELKTDAWAEHIRITKAELEKDRKNFLRMKQELEFNLEKCQINNRIFKKYNETPEGKKKPIPLMPEMDVGKELKAPAQALDEAEAAIAAGDSQATLAKRQQTRDTEQIKRWEKELKEKQFKAPPAKGKKR